MNDVVCSCPVLWEKEKINTCCIPAQTEPTSREDCRYLYPCIVNLVPQVSQSIDTQSENIQTLGAARFVSSVPSKTIEDLGPIVSLETFLNLLLRLFILFHIGMLPRHRNLEIQDVAQKKSARLQTSVSKRHAVHALLFGCESIHRPSSVSESSSRYGLSSTGYQSIHGPSPHATQTSTPTVSMILLVLVWRQTILCPFYFAGNQQTTSG
jgi:hypothetical protein